MKFTSSNQSWYRGIQAVQNAVGSPISNPLVENIFVSCEKEKVVFIATNLNLSIRCEIEANVEVEGKIVVPTDIITNVVKDLPDGDVEFYVENNVIHIYDGEFKVKINGSAADNFPSFVHVQETVKFTLSSEKLKEIIRKTIFATTQEKTRFELDGVCFDIKNNRLNCVSSDGRRLAWYVEEETHIENEDASILIPTKTLLEVLNSIPDEGEVEIKFEDKRIEFSCADVNIVSNLLKYNFPDYPKMIPANPKSKAIVNKEYLTDSIQRASNLASKETNMIVLKFNKNQVEAHAERLEIGGEGRDKITIEYDGGEIENRYNYRFLLEFLRVVNEENIEIQLWESSRPAIFKGKQNNNYIYLVMPMKAPEEVN